MQKTINLTVSSLIHPTYSTIRAYQIKKIDRDLCGVKNCHCGGSSRATYTDKNGYRWEPINV
jgi:hypothetical protein